MPDDVSARAPAVDLGAYAEVVGRTWLGGEDGLARELAERNVSRGEWEGARSFWTKAVDDDVAGGGTALLLTFAARFEASRRTGGSGASPELRGAEQDRDVAVSAGAGPAPVRQEVPSYLQPGVAVAAPLGTAEVDLGKLRDLIAAGAMPFSGKTSPDQLEELRIASAEDAEHRGEGAPEDDADETVMFQPSAAQRAELQTLPFEIERGRAAFPEMDVDQYAAFAAQLEAKGTSSDILERHGVTSPRTLLALRTEQERRLSQAPSLRARFEERKAHFMAFMKAGRS